MEVSISTQPLPPVFERQGRRCYLDPVRKKLIYITPEETVRQQVLSFLMERLKVPVKMIREEEPLVHYGIESRGRADLLIDKYDPEKNELHPLCVIECKARHIMLDENVHRQMIRDIVMPLGVITGWLQMEKRCSAIILIRKQTSMIQSKIYRTILI